MSFTGRAASALARTLAADQRIVDLHHFRQLVTTVAAAHSAAQLTQHPLRGRPQTPTIFVNREAEITALVSAHQIDGQKPLRQRHPTMFKVRVNDHRSQMSALGALVQLMALQDVRFVMPATWTHQSIGPFMALQLGDASSFGGKLLVPIHRVGRKRLHYCKNPLILTINKDIYYHMLKYVGRHVI